jgi:hypothetical protein
MAAWIVLVVLVVCFWWLFRGLQRDFTLLDGRLDRLEEKLEEIKRLR